MNTVILTISLAAFGIFLLSLWKKPWDRDSYYLHDSNLGTFLLTLTIIATQVGGGMVVGVADASYNVGLAALFYPLGSLTGLLIIAFFLADLLKSANLPTISAIFEQKYKFILARKFSSVISSISLFAIMVAQGVAIRHLLARLGSGEVAFTFIWFGVVSYTALGGIKAVVQTNVLQILLISAALVTLLFAALSNSDYTTIELSSRVNYSSVIEWFIWPCCYMIIEQDMAQLFFSAKSKKVIKDAAILSAFGILLLVSIPTFIALLAKTHGLPFNNGILLIFAKTYLSDPIYKITAVAVILAIISTVDSLLCAISSNMAYDFKLVTSYLPSEIILTSIIGIISFIVVFYCENIIGILMFSYSLCVSALFVPSLFGFLLPEDKLLKTSVIFSILFGITSLIILSFLGSNLTYLSLLFSVGGYFMPYLVKKV